MNNSNDIELRFTEGDPEKDFFEQNPHWRYLDSSVLLLKNYKKELVSKIRWGIFLIEDPDSKYHRYSKDKRIDLVNKNYLKGDYHFGYDSEKNKTLMEDPRHQSVIDMYATETMSKIKRDYYEREISYGILVGLERESTKIKEKADVQLKICKINDELIAFRKTWEEEKNKSTASRSKGREQAGILFENRT
jgi:hypothetical protein